MRPTKGTHGNTPHFLLRWCFVYQLPAKQLVHSILLPSAAAVKQSLAPETLDAMPHAVHVWADAM